MKYFLPDRHMNTFKWQNLFIFKSYPTFYAMSDNSLMVTWKSTFYFYLQCILNRNITQLKGQWEKFVALPGLGKLCAIAH